jgi:hypothetical protein
MVSWRLLSLRHSNKRQGRSAQGDLIVCNADTGPIAYSAHSLTLIVFEARRLKRGVSVAVAIVVVVVVIVRRSGVVIVIVKSDICIKGLRVVIVAAVVVVLE